MSLTLWKLDREQRNRLEDLLEAEETLNAVQYAKNSTAYDIEEAREAVAEAQEALAEISELIGNKLGNYAKYIQNLETLKKGVEAKVREFTRRKNAIQRTMDWLKGTLNLYLETHNMRSIEADDFKIAKQKGAPSVQIEIPLDALPEDFQRITIEADKIALRDALKRGETIDGVTLVRNEFLRIKTR